MQVLGNEAMFEPSKHEDSVLVTAIAEGLRFRSQWPVVQEARAALSGRFEPGSGEQPTSYTPISISTTEAAVVTEALGTIIEINKEVSAFPRGALQLLEVRFDELQQFAQADAPSA